MTSAKADYIDTFFALLRSGMYGTPIPDGELPTAIDWKSVASLAEKQTVLGTIIDSVQFLPANMRPSDRVVRKMNGYALGLIKTNLVLDKAVARLVSFFNQHGISGVLLKGQGIARNYRVPQMRQPGDIDFYVGTEAYPRAVELCRKYLINDKDSSSECPKHFSFALEGVEIELHRIAARIYSPLTINSFRQWQIDALERSPERRSIEIAGVTVTLPPVDFDILYIFYHAWSHYIMGGIGLRQLCDWSMLFHTHGDRIDVNRLKENIARFGLTKGWKLFACIAVDRLGVPPDKMPLYDPSYREKSDKILEEIITGGNFGYYSKLNKSYQKHRYGFIYGLAKVPAVTKYFFSLFPLIPVEATCLFFNRLYHGTLSVIKKTAAR